MNDPKPMPTWQSTDPPSAEKLNAVSKAAGLVVSLHGAIHDQFGTYQRRPTSEIQSVDSGALGLITASDIQSDHQARWTYTVAPAEFNESGAVVETQGAETIVAINLLELTHIKEPADEEPWYVWNVNVHQVGMTLTPLPIGGGDNGSHLTDTPVVYHESIQSNGATIFWFRRVGAFFAECGS